MKKKKQQLIRLKYKNQNRILQTIAYQQIRQTKRNGQISRNIQLTKIESRRNPYLNRLITSTEIDHVGKKNKTKKLSTN